jgi:hypothetical protein
VSKVLRGRNEGRYKRDRGTEGNPIKKAKKIRRKKNLFSKTI